MSGLTAIGIVFPDGNSVNFIEDEPSETAFDIVRNYMAPLLLGLGYSKEEITNALDRWVNE